MDRGAKPVLAASSTFSPGCKEVSEAHAAARSAAAGVGHSAGSWISGGHAKSDTLAQYMLSAKHLVSEDQLGVGCLSFRQRQVYSSRLADKTERERHVQLFKSKAEVYNDMDRSTIAQAGVRRARRMARVDNDNADIDLLYPELERRWLAALKKNIIVKHGSKIYTLYLDDTWTVRDIKQAVEERGRACGRSCEALRVWRTARRVEDCCKCERVCAQIQYSIFVTMRSGELKTLSLCQHCPVMLNLL